MSRIKSRKTANITKDTIARWTTTGYHLPMVKDAVKRLIMSCDSTHHNRSFGSRIIGGTGAHAIHMLCHS